MAFVAALRTACRLRIAEVEDLWGRVRFGQMNDLSGAP